MLDKPELRGTFVAGDFNRFYVFSPYQGDFVNMLTLKKLRLAKAGGEFGVFSRSIAFQSPTNPGCPFPSGTKAAKTGLLGSGLRPKAATPFRFSFLTTPAA